jgi:hypothetical protein
MDSCINNRLPSELPSKVLSLGWSIDKGFDMDEFQIYYAKWKKPDTKDYLLDDSMSMTFWKRQKHRDGNWTSCCQGQSMGREDDHKDGSKERFLR